jgi:hypothetical protein
LREEPFVLRGRYREAYEREEDRRQIGEKRRMGTRNTEIIATKREKQKE